MPVKQYYKVNSQDGSLSSVQAITLEGVDVRAATPEQKEAWVHRIFEQIHGKYDLMNDVESFGLHRAWKRTLVRGLVQVQPKAVLDVACGTGDIAIALAAALPEAQVVGLDFCAAMLNVARERAAAAGKTESTPTTPTNLEFIQGNALALPFASNSFDALTISFGLRNLASYEQAAREMLRVLRPGGSLFCLDASYPTAPVIKQGFRLYFRHLLPAMAKLLLNRPAEYRWLNDSTEAFLSKPALAQLFSTAGFEQVHYRSFALGAAALHSARKPTQQIP